MLNPRSAVAETVTDYVPAAAKAALDLLRLHGVQMTATTAAVSGVEQFAITANTTQPPRNSIDTGAHPLRRLEGTWGAAARARLAPPGRARQSLVRHRR